MLYLDQIKREIQIWAIECVHGFTMSLLIGQQQQNIYLLNG